MIQTRKFLTDAQERFGTVLSFIGAAAVRQAATAGVIFLLLALESQEAVGEISLYFAYLMVIVGIADFGIRQYAWQHLPPVGSSEYGRVLAGIVGARACSLAIAVLVYVVAGSLLPAIELDNAIFWLYLPILAFNSVTFDFLYLAAKQERRSNALLATGAGLYAGIAGTMLLAGVGVISVPVAFVASMLVANMALLVGFRRHLRSIAPLSLGSAVPVLRSASPLAGSRFVERAINNGPILAAASAGLSLSELGGFRIVEIGYSFAATIGVHAGSSRFRLMSEDSDLAISRAAIAKLSLLGAALGVFLISVFALVLPGLGLIERSGNAALLLGCALMAAVPVRFFRVLYPVLVSPAALLRLNVQHGVLLFSAAYVGARLAGVTGTALGILFAETLALVLAARYKRSS